MYITAVPTSRRTKPLFIINIDQKMVYIDINGICENQKVHINILCGKSIKTLDVTKGGTYTYHRAIHGQRHWCILHPDLTLKMSWD